MRVQNSFNSFINSALPKKDNSDIKSNCQKAGSSFQNLPSAYYPVITRSQVSFKGDKVISGSKDNVYVDNDDYAKIETKGNVYLSKNAYVPKISANSVTMKDSSKADEIDVKKYVQLENQAQVLGNICIREGWGKVCIIPDFDTDDLPQINPDKVQGADITFEYRIEPMSNDDDWDHFYQLEERNGEYPKGSYYFENGKVVRNKNR